jgi:ferredoxin
VVSGRVRLLADRDVCIGAGLCVMTEPAVFDQDDDGLVTLLVERPEDGERVRTALTNCPSGALRLAQP